MHRIKWNPSATLPFFGEEACGFAVDAVSNVAPGEAMDVREDGSWWQNDWNIASLKRYFEVLFPGFRAVIANRDPDIDRLFAELAEKMGGEDSVCQFTWPVVSVLATKR